MEFVFPKDIMDCMKDCILAIFWPKKDIVDFFINAGCDSKLLEKKELASLSRIEIVNDVFAMLQRREDNGIGQFRQMLKLLINWDYFDSYYFDSLKKLDKEVAKQKIAHLKQLQEVRDGGLKSKREKSSVVNNRIQTINENRQELKEEFLFLSKGIDYQGRTVNKQKRGYLFETFLQKLFRSEGLEVTEAFKIEGEQIDGAVKFEGTHYLIEAKWQDKCSASDSLYHFAYKVAGKMYGRGIFISINGFSAEAVSALQLGKSINTILIDGMDLALVLDGMYSLKDLLDNKIKAAQTMGRIYVNPHDLSEK